MKQYTLSLLLVLFVLNGNNHLIASDPDKLEGSLIRSRNYTLGPTLDDVPGIYTLDLQMQEAFRTVGFNVVPKKFRNANQSYELIKRSLPENFEEKAKEYLTKEREKQNAWRIEQNRLKELRPYTSQPLERGERDPLKGARRARLAFDWLKAQTLELKIAIQGLENLLLCIQREHDIKHQIIEDYEGARRQNRNHSYANLNSYIAAWYNYSFNENFCRALSTVYEFKFRPLLEDDHSRSAHTKREAFVTAIPKSYTPKTLPKRKQNPKVSIQEPTFSSDKNEFEEEWKQFMQSEQEKDPTFDVTLGEFTAYKEIVRQTQQSDSTFSMNYQNYSAFRKLNEKFLEQEEQTITPQEYMSYMVMKIKMGGIALSYEDYLMKLELRDKLTEYSRKRNRVIDDTLDFTSLKQNLFELLERYQGIQKLQSDQPPIIGGLLGKYLGLHKKIGELDKKLIAYKLVNFSLYELEKYEGYLRPLPSTPETIVKKPFYVVVDDFKKWEEIGLVEVVPLKKPYEETRTKKKEKVKSETSSSKEARQLPGDIIEKTVKFIKQAYQDFNLEIFLLGLCGDQAEFLHKCLQEQNRPYAIKGLRPVQIGGREWVFSLASITGINLGAIDSEQPPECPLLVQHTDKMVTTRIRERFKIYQDTLEEHQRTATAIEEQINTSKATIKTLRYAQSSGIGSLMLDLSTKAHESFSASKTPSQFENELKSLQESLNLEKDNGSALENEQVEVVNTLNKIFNSQELSYAFHVYDEGDEALSLLQQIGKEAGKLQGLLKQRKETDSQEKAKLKLAIGLLKNISLVVTYIQKIEENRRK
jgi:hypothetical protein